MLKCGIFPIFLIFKMVTATLIQLHLREEKTTRVSCFLMKKRHQSFRYNALLSYIRPILGEILF